MREPATSTNPWHPYQPLMRHKSNSLETIAAITEEGAPAITEEPTAFTGKYGQALILSGGGVESSI